MRRRSKNSMTRTTSPMISGPMPSPGRISTLRLEWVSAMSGRALLRHAELPRARQAGLLLVRSDVGVFLFGQADVVEPVQQAVLAERVDVEMHLLPVGTRDRLAFEV